MLGAKKCIDVGLGVLYNPSLEVYSSEYLIEYLSVAAADFRSTLYFWCIVQVRSGDLQVLT